MTRVIKFLQTEYPVKVYQWMTIWVVLIGIWAAGLFGAVVYVRDQSDDLRRAEAERCVQRVESREQIRGAFLDVYEVIDAGNPTNDFTARARERLDDNYPPLSLRDCVAESSALNGGTS